MCEEINRLDFIRYLSENQGINVICVEVPPVSAVSKCPDPFEHARMKANRRWMANTPVVMRIEDLVVKEIVNTFNENK